MSRDGVNIDLVYSNSAYDFSYFNQSFQYVIYFISHISSKSSEIKKYNGFVEKLKQSCFFFHLVVMEPH